MRQPAALPSCIDKIHKQRVLKYETKYQLDKTFRFKNNDTLSENENFTQQNSKRLVHDSASS